MKSPDQSPIEHVEQRESLTVPSVQVLLLRQRPGAEIEIFLGKRSAGGFMHQWGTPGGKIDPGESSRAAALRELHEETGVTLASSRLQFYKHETSMTIRERDGVKQSYQYDIDVYFADASDLDPVNASPGEYADMRWYTLTEALRMHDDVRARGESVQDDTQPGLLTPRVAAMVRALQSHPTLEEIPKGSE
jgi:8-oxo-dGTP pyrophosphatase MutT (NUDIX family)